VNTDERKAMYSDDNMAFIHQLEELAGFVGKEADDESRDLIADVQDEFENLKRGAVRDGLSKPGPLTAQDVLDFGAAVGEDFPKAQKGCEVFASVVIVERVERAPLN
jgi:hypothetical protein